MITAPLSQAQGGERLTGCNANNNLDPSLPGERPTTARRGPALVIGMLLAFLARQPPGPSRVGCLPPNSYWRFTCASGRNRDDATGAHHEH